MIFQGQQKEYIFSVIPKGTKPPQKVGGVFMAVQSNDPFGCSVDGISLLGEIRDLNELPRTLVAADYSHLYLMPEFDHKRREEIVADLATVYSEVQRF
jgi:hypothetical protein